MNQANDLLNRVRIASPCGVSWENMTGDERARFCNQCQLHVYNFSALTEKQIATMLTQTEGRICGRLYRRADGTMLTRDCPVGLRALRRRTARMAGAVLTAVLSLCSGIFGQTHTKHKSKACATVPTLRLKQTATKDTPSTFKGTVLDVNGAVLTNAKVTLINERTKAALTITTTDEGAFAFSNLSADQYTLTLEAVGFKLNKLEHLTVAANEALTAEVTMSVASGAMEMGIIVIDEPTMYSNGTLIINRKMIESLPIHE